MAGGGSPQPCGFDCANHPAVQDSNPKDTIYAFAIYSSILHYICHCVEEIVEMNKKRPP